ncbi:MAG: hypothetical protein PHE30_03355, partial [Candidatus Omnitrophica bacterium]|nr:hypothetical protein [Candidatus Omnitrophota bacterium]
MGLGHIFNTPKTNKIEDRPRSKLKAGKTLKIKIKNPNKYNTGNFIKSNNKNLFLGLRSKAISSRFKVNRKLAI